MASMNELSKHILAVGSDNELPVTNLQLQKVMFFAIGMHIRMNGIDDLVTDTYDIPFKKWKYGPVIESIYYKYNIYKKEDLTKYTKGTYSEQYKNWDTLIINLLKQDPFKLVRVSHDMPSWKDYEKEIINLLPVDSYTLDEIAEDFSDE